MECVDYGKGGEGGVGALTSDSISQETQEHNNSTYALWLYWQDSGKRSASQGRLLRAVTEKWLHNSMTVNNADFLSPVFQGALKTAKM